MKFRIIGAAVAATIALGLGACATTPTEGVSAADGPATEQTVETTEPTTETEAPVEEDAPVEEAEPVEDEPTEEEIPEPAIATFAQKYTYEDGVQVEVIRKAHSKVTKYDAEIIDDKDVAKAGDDVVYLEVRVKNGSKKSIDAWGTWTMSYGADGIEAPTSYLPDGKETTSLDGKILPGKSKTASENFMIPAKQQGDVVLEFTATLDHDPAIFSGSVK